MNNYGLYISDGTIPIVNDDSPLMIEASTLSSSLSSQMGSVYIQSYTDPSINQDYAPLIVTDCSSGYVKALGQTTGIYYIVSQSSSLIKSKVLTTSSYNPYQKQSYGMESFDSNGKLVFSSYQIYPKIASITSYNVSDVTNMVIYNATAGSGAVVNVNHAYALKPYYSLASLNQHYFYYKSWYTRTAVGYNYSSVGYIATVGLKQQSNTQCSLTSIATFYQVSQAINDPAAGYAAGLYVLNVINSFGRDTLTRVLNRHTTEADEEMYMFTGQSNPGVLYVIDGA